MNYQELFFIVILSNPSLLLMIQRDAMYSEQKASPFEKGLNRSNLFELEKTGKMNTRIEGDES